ncbi:MAG TPA: YicC/YloC family endoribonuclease [Polyangiaceae bacterium]|nr:YicC/YloC family endoribonuclease [Polyangiaceae bacterium]
MRSMTGFGCGDADLDGNKLTCELRALNHRFLDVRVRMPDELAAHAFFVEQLAREHLSRGRFDIGVRLDESGSAVRFSTRRARAVYESLLQLRDELAPGTEVPVAALASLPQLLMQDSSRATSAGLEQALSRAFTAALARLDEMREREGQALTRELSDRLESLRALAAEAKTLCHGAAERQLERLRERVGRLLEGAGANPDPGRLETELALIADRSDVTEELVRLASHFDQFAALLRDSAPIGRRLEFLLQEMSREANTLGSKSQDVRLSHLVVDIKSQLEKIREQVQNVE